VSTNKNIWILSGETSGDAYGAALAKSLVKTYGGNIIISGMGGTAMKQFGINILVDSTELGVVGLIEVFKNIFTFIKIFRFLVKKAEQERPDAVILIDYPGFNIRFAKQMYKRNIKVVWYVSPQVWAWKKNRIYKLAKYCAKMLVIFPFEVDVYKKTKLDVEFVGHPLVDIVKEKLGPSQIRDPEKLLLAPGSRYTEINRILKPMLETAVILKEKHPHLKFKISATRPSLESRIREIINSFELNTGTKLNFEIECGQNLKLLQECGTGLLKSGTITVESAIVGLPSVVLYKVNPLTFLIGRIVIGKFFRGFFCMINIIANKTIYEEFMQDKATPKSLADAIEKILPGGNRREFVLKEIDYLTNNLLTYGKSQASDNATEAIKKVIS
jgi:lipid-A-disaccharide synthase